MSDFGTPATPNIKPVDGLATLGSLMELKQRKQALVQQQIETQQQQQTLQTGAIQQQSAQATAVKDQQSAKEIQAGAQLMADPVGAGITDASGKPTDNAYTIIKRAMPTTGDQHYKSLVDAATGAVQYRSAWTGLRAEQQNMISAKLAGVAADGNANLGDIYDSLNATRDQFKGTPAEGDVNTLIGVARKAVDAAADKHGMAGVRQVVNGLSRGGIGNAGITGAGGVATPQAATVDTGATVQPGTVAPALQGGGFTAGGPPVTKTLAPAQKPDYLAQAAGASGRGAGIASADVERANQISGGVQGAQAAIGLSQRVDDLAEQIQSGKFAQWVKKQTAALGLKDDATTARQLLEKDLGQLKTQAAGNASSDQKMQTILSGYPESTSTPQTIHAAMDYIRGSFRQQAARGQALNKYRDAHPNLEGFQHADDVLTGNTDPLMHEYMNLTTPQQRIGFYQRNFHNAEDAAAFKARVQGLTHVIGR